MNNERARNEDFSEWRSKAEELIEKNLLTDQELSPKTGEMIRLAHELAVHQVELEMQYEELGKSRDELEKSLRRYSDLYELAPLGYVSISHDGSIVKLNLSAAKMLGMERSRLLGKPFSCFVLFQDLDTFRSFVEKAFSRNSSRYCEVLRLKQTGITGDKTITVSIDAVTDDDGKECNIVLSDISRLKEIENSMLVTNERMKFIMDSTRSGFWEWDLQDNSSIWSDELWLMIDEYGLNPMKHKASFDLWIQFIVPEDREKTERAVLDALKKEEDFSVECRVRDRCGQQHWFLSKGTPVKVSDNKIERYVGILIEITDLKNARESSNKTEALNKTIIDSIPGPFYIIDEKGNYAGWNAFDREVIAGRAESEMSATRVIETVHPEDRALVEETISKVMNSGADGTVEGRILLRGGPQFRWFSMSGRRTVIDGHSFLVGIGTDITERKKIEDVQLFLSYTSYVSREEPFFNALARFLAETLSMDFVCIDILEGDGLTARTLAVWCDGHFKDNIVYSLADTPCGAVVREDICCFPANVCQFFPHDKVLQELNAESYAGVTLPDHSGRPIGLIAVIGRDPLDDRRLAENVLKIVSVRAAGELERLLNETALRKSEKKYRDLFESVPIGLYQSTMDGRIISANRRCLDICRCRTEDMEAWFNQDTRKSYVNPEDGARLREMLMKEGFVDNYETEFFRMDNTTSWLSNTARLVKGENGEQDIISGSFVEITKRKEAEKELKKLSAAIEQSPAVVVITDPEGNIEYVNPEFSKLTGYLSGDVIGQNPRILQSGLMSKDTYKELWQTILAGEIWRGELHNRKKNGELYWEMAVISALRDHNGDITSFVAVKEDITEKKILWNDLVAAKEKAEESDRLKSAFLANISHEIRTPMNGILGFSALLKEPRLSGEEQQEYIDLIQQSGERMLCLINDLIDISRIDANETQMQVAETSINKLMHNLYLFFKPEADNKKLGLICKTGLAEKESIIVTDSGKLTQIITNLIQNALKFTAEGHIAIGYVRKDNMLEFYVADTGIGVPVEMENRIFERFRQIDNSLSRAHEGAGLGLSISKALVEMLGGRIWVESAESGGSRFMFTLPYIQPYSVPFPGPCSDRNTRNDPVTLPRLTIAVAEDDVISSMLLEKSLKGENITVFSVANGKEVVRIVECHPEIDLVLMDIKMPVMNGYEATRLIKNIRPDLPVIIQSAFTSPDERKKAEKAGCDAFMLKPIKKDDLLLLIRSILER